MRPDQQRMFAIVLLIIAALLLMVSSSLMVYALVGSKQQPIITTLVTFSTPTPTPDNGFSQFLTGFAKALATGDVTTVASETDQSNFHMGEQLSNPTLQDIKGYGWDDTYAGLQSGVLTLTIQTPFLYTCQQSFNITTKYAQVAVMGTYALQPYSYFTVTGTGLAAFVFEQLEQGGSWYWVDVALNTAQCAPGSSNP